LGGYSRGGSGPAHERIAVWGSASECLDGLRKVVNAGAELVLLTPLFDEAEQLEIFAAEFKPNL
jgi:hypothetical protein